MRASLLKRLHLVKFALSVSLFSSAVTQSALVVSCDSTPCLYFFFLRAASRIGPRGSAALQAMSAVQCTV